MKIAANAKTFVRTFFAIAVVVSLAALYQTEIQTQALVKLRTRYKWALLMLVFALNAAVGLYVVLRGDRTEAFWERTRVRFSTALPGRIIGMFLTVLPVPLFLFARADFFGRGLDAFFRLLWLFWWLALVQAVGLRMFSGTSCPMALAAVVLVDGLAAQSYTLSLPTTAYPFSTGWSEASRFYYASLVFSKSVYGVQLPLSIWHGTRYMLLAIPFLIKGLPLWAARLWQVLLWFGLTIATSAVLVRRLRLRDKAAALILGGWFFLYVFQGAVYYHLQVCVIIILLFVNTERSWLSLLAVLAASFWAGMSRLNWFPVPALLAISIYVLEVPYPGGRKWWRYIRTPLVWGAAGLAAALAGQAFYIAISGNTNFEAFGSSLTSALLWYRWLPSPTNPIGIIPGVIIISLPLWLLVFWSLHGDLRAMHPVRLAALLAMLGVLLAGGLVVSTKIGGGGDLHNMDAYMVLLALIALYFVGGRVGRDADPARAWSPPAWPIVVSMLLVPVAFALQRIGSPVSYDPIKAQGDVSVLRQQVQTYSQTGDVLFMYERQLLTFGAIPHVHMVPDYEVVSLMEMAISGNRPYLERFYGDLASHRFAAIVAHPQNLGVETGDFIEESNVWNRLVAQPLLCQYKPALTLDYSKVQILVPRARPCPEFPPSIGGK